MVILLRVYEYVNFFCPSQDEKQILERRLAGTEADLQQKLSTCQEVHL